MLYRIGHIVRDKLPFIWDVFGYINSILFALRYDKAIRRTAGVLEKYAEDGLKIVELDTINIEDAASFFEEQPEEAFTFFRPHGFDKKSLLKLAKDKSFLAFLLIKDSRIVGYFFLRSFVWGKCYRGYMVDYKWRRKGLNKFMNRCATDIAALYGMRTFGTISPENTASLKSAEAVNEIKIIKTLDSGDYFVEYI